MGTKVKVRQGHRLEQRATIRTLVSATARTLELWDVPQGNKALESRSRGHRTAAGRQPTGA